MAAFHPSYRVEIYDLDQTARHDEQGADDVKRRRYHPVDQVFGQHRAPDQRKYDLERINDRRTCGGGALLCKHIQRLRKGDDEVGIDKQAGDNRSRPRDRAEGRRLQDHPNRKADDRSDNGDPDGQGDGIVFFCKVIQLHKEQRAQRASDKHDDQAPHLRPCKAAAKRKNDARQHQNDRDPRLFVNRFSHRQQDDGKHHDRDRKGERAG